MTDTLSDKIVEAGARGVARLRFRFLQWDELGDEVRQMLIAEARACLSAALAAAEAEGVVLCKVPDADTPPEEEYGLTEFREGRRVGYNACRAATLAGKVTL
jgi:hypothetical protein